MTGLIRVYIWFLFLTLWLFTVIAVGPQPTDVLKRAVAMAGLGLFLGAALLVLARGLGMRPLGDFALTGPTSRRPALRWTIITGGAIAYTSVMLTAHQVANETLRIFELAPSTEPAFQVVDQTQLPTDLIRTVWTSLHEEILMFAVPIGLAAYTWRTVSRIHPTRRWLLAPIVAATVLVVVGLRMAGHSYWGWGVLAVLPWMAGAWLIFRICGSVWSLVAGHMLYDFFAFTLARVVDNSMLAEIFMITVFVGFVALLLGPTLVGRATMAVFRPAVSYTLADSGSISAVR